MSDNDIRIKSIDNVSSGHKAASDSTSRMRTPSVSRKRSCLTVFLVLIASFIIGGLGGLFFDGILLSYLSKIPFLGNSDLVQVEGSKVIIQRGERTLTDSDLIVKDLRKSTSNSVVGIRKELKKSPPSKININPEFLGSGVVLTADGLIVTSAGIFTDRQAGYQVVDDNGTVYQVENIIYDPASEIALVKAQADDLSVAELDSSEVKVGQTLYSLVTDQLGQLAVASVIVEAKNYQPNFPLDSEKVENYLQSSVKYISLGGPLFNYQGKVVGIKVAQDDESTLIFPASDISSVLDKVIAEDKITRLEFGVKYVNLNDKIAKANDLSRTRGLLIYSAPSSGQSAVKPNSPAYKAGLKANDIITKIGEDEIDSYYLLPQSLQKYSAEEQVEITYWRDNQELQTKVILKEVKQVK